MSHARSETPMNSMGGSVHHPSANTHALQNLTRVLTKRRKWIIGSIVICELLAIVLTLMMKPTYGATATIELNKSGAGSLDLGLGDDALAQQLDLGRGGPSHRSPDGNCDPPGRLAGPGSHSAARAGLAASVRRQGGEAPAIAFRAGIAARTSTTDADAVVGNFQERI